MRGLVWPGRQGTALKSAWCLLWAPTCSVTHCPGHWCPQYWWLRSQNLHLQVGDLMTLKFLPSLDFMWCWVHQCWCCQRWRCLWQHSHWRVYSWPYCLKCVLRDDELSQSHLLYLSVGVAMKMAAGMMLSLVWESAGGWLMIRMWMCWPCDKMATQDLNQQYQQIEQEGRSFVLGRRTLLWTVGCSRQVIDGLYLCRKTQWQKSRGCHWAHHYHVTKSYTLWVS